MGLYVADIKNKYKDYLVTLTLPNKIGTIEGFIDETSFSLSTSANWGNSAITGTGTDFVKGGLKKLVGRIPLLGKMGENFISQFKNIGNTINLYEGSGEISLDFSMNIIFGVNTNDWKDVELKCNKVTQPDYNGNAGILIPYVYPVSALKDVAEGDYKQLDGLMGMISIGEWFTADKLKFDNLGRAYSLVLNEDGKNVYMTLQVKATPYRDLDANEVTSWFK